MLKLRLNASKEWLEKTPDKIIALLRIEEDSSSNIVVFDYDEDDMTFKTRKTKQTLIVEIDSPETFGNPPRPRFHLHRIEYTRPDLVEGMEHSLHAHTTQTWLPHDLDKHMPTHTKTLKLKLKIKGKDSLYVKLIGWDLKTGAEVPCDPLVGNEPPKDGEEEVEI